MSCRVLCLGCWLVCYVFDHYKSSVNRRPRSWPRLSALLDLSGALILIDALKPARRPKSTGVRPLARLGGGWDGWQQHEIPYLARQRSRLGQGLNCLRGHRRGRLMIPFPMMFVSRPGNEQPPTCLHLDHISVTDKPTAITNDQQRPSSIQHQTLLLHRGFHAICPWDGAGHSERRRDPLCFRAQLSFSGRVKQVGPCSEPTATWISFPMRPGRREVGGRT